MFEIGRYKQSKNISEIISAVRGIVNKILNAKQVFGKYPQHIFNNDKMSNDVRLSSIIYLKILSFELPSEKLL